MSSLLNMALISKGINFVKMFVHTAAWSLEGCWLLLSLVQSKTKIVPSELQLEIHHLVHHLVKFRSRAQPEPLQVSEQIAGASRVLH
jgi:hypothetical protein